MLDVSILIISYNTRELTVLCLESIYAQTRGIGFEVIVVDNASTDGSAAAIHEQFPAVQVIEPGENIGFARANNLAARTASGEFLLLLNPDTVVLDHAIGRIVAFGKANSDAGIIGGRTLYGDGSLNATSCFGLPTLWSAFCRAMGLSALCPNSALFNPEDMGGWKRDSVRDVGAITGCFALIRRSLWEQLAGFDESFFMYSEDTDLSHRIWKAGYRCTHFPDATIIHYGGRSETSRSAKIAKVFRAKCQYMRKYWRPWQAQLGEHLLVTTALARTIVLGLVHTIRPSTSESYRRWRDVWACRREWRAQPTERKFLQTDNLCGEQAGEGAFR